MKIHIKKLALALFIVLVTTSAGADSYVTCKSEGYAYQRCYIQDHGYVRISRKLSKSSCIQGRSWDYDRSSIWVDDGCAAEFVVERRHHTSGHKKHKGEKAAAAIIGLALLAAVTKKNKHDKYNDNNYHGGRHSSYIPNWMIGSFSGYNINYGSEVSMRIDSDGRMTGYVNGTRLSGYVNDNRLYIGNAEFYLNKVGRGLNTTQVGNTSNVVYYQRD